MRGAGGNARVHLETVIAWGLVALFHAIFAWVVYRPVFIEPGNFGPPLQVVFIQRPRAKLQRVTQVVGAVPIQARVIASLPHNKPLLSGKTHAGPQSDPIPMVGSDEWDRPVTTPSNGIAFAHNPFDATYNPRPRPAPGRFRMRRQSSPADIVRGVSQVLGFWPPGYSDDPCAGIDKAVEMLMAPATRGDQSLLTDALREQEKYCM